MGDSQFRVEADYIRIGERRKSGVARASSPWIHAQDARATFSAPVANSYAPQAYSAYPSDSNVITYRGDDSISGEHES